MNKREQAKAEIRFYKRFLDELDFAMSGKTTYANLKSITARFGIPMKVLDDFIRQETISGIHERSQSCFRPGEAMDDVPFHFSFTDEPDYEWADDLRIALHHQITLEQYYQSGQQREIICELEQEDQHLTRRCVWCGDPVVGKRADAMYCSNTCRTYSSRARTGNAPFRRKEEIRKTEKKQWWFFLIGK